MPAASYPGSVKTYTDKVDGVSVVQAADINSVQAEVTAVETALGTNPATSLLPSAGSYNPNGVSTSVSARITNLEAGLTGESTDGARVGYTVIATGSIASGTNTISISQTSFVKIVVLVNITTAGSGTQITLGVNGGSASKYTYNVFAASGTTAPTATSQNGGSGGIPISFTSAPTDGFNATAEIYNGRSTAIKPVTWYASNGWGNGIITNGAVVNSITITMATGPTAGTYTVYGVK